MGYMNNKTGELKDEKVVKDILQSADYYQGGCIVEAQSILKSIVIAIDGFMDIHDKKSTGRR